MLNRALRRNENDGIALDYCTVDYNITTGPCCAAMQSFWYKAGCRKLSNPGNFLTFLINSSLSIASQWQLSTIADVEDVFIVVCGKGLDSTFPELQRKLFELFRKVWESTIKHSELISELERLLICYTQTLFKQLNCKLKIIY